MSSNSIAKVNKRSAPPCLVILLLKSISECTSMFINSITKVNK